MRGPLWRLSWTIGWAIGLAVCGAARLAHAELSMERFPGVTACEEAASYDERDTSLAAERARRRCRLEQFDARYAERRAETAAREETARVRRVEKWTTDTSIPARGRPLAVDGYVAGGLSNYGLAVSWLLLPQLEIEGWFGSHSSLNTNDYSYDNNATTSSYLSSSPSSKGVRGKWLLFRTGNFTPYLGLGGAFCNSKVDGGNYTYSFNGLSQSSTFGGHAKAHLITVSLGLTLTMEIGLRFSLEYLYASAIYTSASNDGFDAPHDEAMRAAWASQLSGIAGGLRFQAGYAF